MQENLLSNLLTTDQGMAGPGIAWPCLRGTTGSLAPGHSVSSGTPRLPTRSPEKSAQNMW